MSRIVHVAIGGLESDLIVLDAGLRTYAARSRDGSSYHLMQPARLDDPRVGDGKRQAGQLVCTCQAGTFHGTCYRIAEAEAFEAGAAVDLPWLADAPTGAGDLVEAYRG